MVYIDVVKALSVTAQYTHTHTYVNKQASSPQKNRSMKNEKNKYCITGMEMPHIAHTHK